MADMSVSSFLVVLFAVLVIAIATYAAHLEDRLDAERRARRVEHELARIFQEIAHEERERGDAWMERALYPEAGKTLWEAIDSFLEKERER